VCTSSKYNPSRDLIGRDMPKISLRSKENQLYMNGILSEVVEQINQRKSRSYGKGTPIDSRNVSII